MDYAWSITPEKISAAVQRLAAVGKPRKIILFGSAARGRAGINSDADFLVITKQEVPPRRESVRLRKALKDIMMPMEIVVISEEKFRALAQQPGLVYREALQSGRVLYEAED